MDGAFKDSDRFFSGEQWVVGDATAAQSQDRTRVLAELRARYRADYVAAWRGFLRAASVARPGNTADAARRLGALGGAQSPLLALLALVARNTAVDSGIAVAFQPVHAVTSPGAADKYVSPANEPYVNGLLALQGAMEQLGNMPPVVDTASALAIAQAAQQALAQATQAKVAARQLAQKFAVDSAAAQVGPVVATLLESPITGAEGALRGVAATRPPTKRVAAAAAAAGGGGGGPSVNPAALATILNERGRALCSAMTPMLAKFPFNPDAAENATLAEVSAMLAPGTGALWAFQAERLEPVLEKQGAQWVPKAGAPVALSGAFVTFFNRAARVSDALFHGGGPEPRVVLTARALLAGGAAQVSLSQGTTIARFKQNTPPVQLVWPAASGRDARLWASIKGKDIDVARGSGEWALFRLVAQASRFEGGGGAWRAEWSGGRGLAPGSLELTFASGLPVLRRGWLGDMACAAQVTR